MSKTKFRVWDKKESQIKKEIADYLRLKGCVVLYFRNVGIKKLDGSYIPIPSGELGVSDLIGSMPSKSGAIPFAAEIKRPGQKMTQLQKDWQSRVRLKD